MRKVTQNRIKFADAQSHYLRYFQLSSEIISRTSENQPSCCSTLNDKELKKEFLAADRRLGLLKTFDNLRGTSDRGLKFKKNTLLIFRFDVSEEEDSLEVLTFENVNRAIEAYDELEREYGINADVVLVRGESEKNIQDAFRNYFSDARAFVDLMRQGIQSMTCPLCLTEAALQSTPVPGGPADASVDICANCADPDTQPDHFRPLASTMWSDDPATQVLAARILKRLDTDWARDLSDQLYLDDDTRAWADNKEQQSAHKDSNGAPLTTGDTVVLIKDLPVKGAGFTAKRGTAVYKITLVPDNPAHIEGRVEGQRIVILTEFVKKRG
jgi:protein PhnA